MNDPQKVLSEAKRIVDAMGLKNPRKNLVKSGTHFSQPPNLNIGDVKMVVTEDGSLVQARVSGIEEFINEDGHKVKKFKFKIIE